MATSLASVHPRGVDPKEAQIDVGGDDPEAVAASSLAPREAARRVPGGWRLSGHYPFSSGCDYAQWAIIGAFLGPKGDPWGVADLLVPLAEVEIVDDGRCSACWAPAPSRKTDSPPSTARSWSATCLPAPRRVPRCIRNIWYCARRVGSWCPTRCHRSPSLGRRALDIAYATLATRVSRGVTRVAQSEVVQMVIGEAAAAIDSLPCYSTPGAKRAPPRSTRFPDLIRASCGS